MTIGRGENEDQLRQNRAGFLLLRENFRPWQMTGVRLDKDRRHFPIVERRYFDRVMSNQIREIDHREEGHDPDQDEGHDAVAAGRGTEPNTPRHKFFPAPRPNRARTY